MTAFIIAVTVLGIIFLTVIVIGYFMLGRTLPAIFMTALGSAEDREDLVDPEAEIMPSQERLSSEVLKDEAAAMKAVAPLPITPPQQAIAPVYQASEVAPGMPNVAVAPPPAPVQPPVQAPVANDYPQTELYQPPQELVQRPAILDSPTPIVQTPLAPIQAELPHDVPDTHTSEKQSSYGVRDSSHPAGRLIRDKRRNRNAS